MGYKVYVRQLFKSEIDFVAEKADSTMDRMYWQTNIDGIRHIHLRDFLKMSLFH